LRYQKQALASQIYVVSRNFMKEFQVIVMFFLHCTSVRGNLLYCLYLILYHCFLLHSPTETPTAVLSTQAPNEAVSRQGLTYAVITQAPTDVSATTETPTSLSGIGKLDLSFVVVLFIEGGGIFQSNYGGSTLFSKMEYEGI
jgi:hypothetical protein